MVNKKEKIKVKCDFCSRELEIYPYLAKAHKNHYCNQKCHNKHTWSINRDKIIEGQKNKQKTGWIINCLNCGKERYVTKATVKKFCSRKCMDEYMVGENSQSWKGGVCSENELQRKCKQYRDWRESVFIRDDYTCQQCSKVGGYLHAHHIKEFSEYPELRFDIDNGITLCKDCHMEVHHGS